MTISSTTSLGATPALSSLGVGSGIDLQSIVQKLMAVESQPLQRLQKQQSDYQAQLSAYGKLSSALSTFQTAMQGFTDPTQFQAFTTTSSNQNVLSATADSSATAGNYQLTVSKLAQAQTDTSQGFADSNTTTVGSAGDQMTITVGSNSATINVGGQTLQQIADGINQSSSNPGVTASVINNGSTSNPYQLMLTADKPGGANGFSLSFTNSSGSAITDPLGTSTAQPAQDAAFTVNNVAVSSTTNTVTGVLPGVTLNLNGVTSTGSTVTLSVAQDQKGIGAQVQKFVDAYNTVHSAIGSTQTGTSTSDSTVRLMQSMLFNTLNTPASGASSTYSYLAQVGVSVQKDGTLSVDTSTLNSALASDPNGTANLFASFAGSLVTLGQQLSGPQGLVQTRTQGLNNNISNVQDQIDQMQQYLDSYQQTLTKQYSALDQLLGNMKGTSNYLTQQLASLPKA
ncbi:MAG: flagellar filament capping protein FliD [Gammaproteobacteria bacterium]